MRPSLFTAAFFMSVAASGCGIDPKVQNLTDDTTEPPKTATKDWDGEAITIRNEGVDDGVNPAFPEGGVEVRVSPAATRVSVEAVFGAFADDDLPSHAWTSIEEAKKTFTLSETATGVEIACGRGGKRGTARGAGCKLLRVTIPAGTADKPHGIAVRSGSGAIRVGGDGSDPPHVKTLLADATGAGVVDVRVRPVKDATVAVTGQHAVTVALPSDFSARKVVFTVEAASSASSVTTDFAGMADGAAFPPGGASPDAAAELSIRSRGEIAADLIRVSRF